MTLVTESTRRLAPLLWSLLALFVVRVVGQLLVVLGWGAFLPSIELWSSGLIPYPWLFLAQILIILLYGKVCLDFTRGSGFFVVPRPELGRKLLIFGSGYVLVMGIRVLIFILRSSNQPWMGGWIPIGFHMVLAAFILVVGGYHWHRGRLRQRLR